VYRYGSSWVTGQVPSVVYGWGPPLAMVVVLKLCAGAPGSPQNTGSHAVGPRADIGVPGDVLLLGAVLHGAVELGVGDEAAAAQSGVPSQ